MELGDIEQAQKHFQIVLDMLASKEPRALARNRLLEIAVRELKARGPEMDAVLYLPAAMRQFSRSGLPYETAMRVRTYKTDYPSTAG